MIYKIEDYILFEQWLDAREDAARAYHTRVRKRQTTQTHLASRLKALLQSRRSKLDGKDDKNLLF